MSTTEVPVSATSHERRESRHEARDRRHPRLGRRPGEGVLREPRVEARRRLRLRQRLPDRPVHAARVGVLGPVRHGHHVGRARLGRRACTWSSPTSRPRTTISSAHGVDASEVFHAETPGATDRFDGTSGRASGPRPDHAQLQRRSPSSAIRTATSGSCRRSPAGCPGASTPPTTAYTSAADLASALERAAAAHGEHEKRTGERDANWPEWYAAYMVAEQAGDELPS